MKRHFFIILLLLILIPILTACTTDNNFTDEHKRKMEEMEATDWTLRINVGTETVKAVAGIPNKQICFEKGNQEIAQGTGNKFFCEYGCVEYPETAGSSICDIVCDMFGKCRD